MPVLGVSSHLEADGLQMTFLGKISIWKKFTVANLEVTSQAGLFMEKRLLVFKV